MYFGLDIGGTKIELAVFDSSMTFLWKKRISTPKQDYQQFILAITQLIKEADDLFHCHGKVGIGIPGLFDKQSGIVFTTNIPAAKGKTLLSDLEMQLSRSIKINNDAKCFALSEAWHEDFQTYRYLLGIVLGTGVGAGLIMDRHLISGHNTSAGEIGHLSLTVDALLLLGKDIPLRPCGCGKTGCFENYISGLGFEWLFHYFYHRHLDSKSIITLYYEHDLQAVAHVNRYLELFSLYLGNIVTLFDPEIIVIGGGLSNFELLYTALPRYLSPHLLPFVKPPIIEKARFGDAGGARGAALLQWQNS